MHFGLRQGEFKIDIIFEKAIFPSNGGPGTNIIYLLGILLTAFAGAGLVMRKRRRDAA